MLQFILSILTPSLLLSFFLKKWLCNPTEHKNRPPSPSQLPILGNLHQLGLYPHRSLHSLAQRHGPLMLLKFGSRSVVIVSSADVAAEIMKTHDLIFANRPKLGIMDKLLYDGKDVASAPYGEYWRQMKSICVLQLLSNKRVQSFRNIREEEIAIFLKKIEQASSQSLPVNLSEMFASLTNDIICRVALGRKYSDGEGGRKFKKLMEELMLLLGTLTLGDFITWLSWTNTVTGVDAKVKKVSKEFDQFLDEVIQDHIARRLEGFFERKEKDEQKDLVDVLLELQQDQKQQDGFTIARDSIKALILDMFTAGTDTTSTALEWTMSELLRHPRVMKELQKEVRGIARTNGGKLLEVSEGDLVKMHYLKAVVKETLRLHPPIPLLVPHESTQDVTVKGYDVAAGTIVFANSWSIGGGPNIWDQPDEFRPERFLNSPVDFRGHDFQFIPFGAGRRGCPGISFAAAAIEAVLANLANKFDWTLPGGGNGEDLDMSESPGATIHKKFPLLVVATPCSSH